jgi:hypothetical protein
MTTGIFNTSGFTTDFAKKSFAGMLTRLMPNGNAPLFVLSSMLPTEQAVQVEHGFFTKTMLFPEVQLNGAIADGTTQVFIVDTTANILPNMLMRVQSTGENILVRTILSSTTMQVQRGVGTVAAAAIADDVKIYQIGTAFEESSVRPNALQINPVRITNLTQIFRNTWAISGSAQATEVIAGETNVQENRQDCAAFHAADIEKNLFFGQKSSSTLNGQPFRTMDGLLNIVNTLANYPSSYAAVNVTALGSTTTYTQLENALDPVFNQTTDPKGGNERVLFVGGTARKVINHIGRKSGQYQIVDGQTAFGLQFGSFKIARGTFRMIEHPLFNTNADWSKYGVAVDMATFRVAYLGGRKTQKKDFNMDGSTAVDNGIDAVGGTLTTELTTVVKNPPANAWLTNFTAGAAD